MGRLVDTWNAAVRIAALWRQGLTPAIVVSDLLSDLGFTDIEFNESSVTARFHGVALPLNNEEASHEHRR